jgi:PAS domain S-box-containing protein
MQDSQLAPGNERAKQAAATPFFNLAHEPLCLLDSGGRILAINEAFSTLLGYQQDDAAGAAFLEWIHPAERRPSVAVLGAALAGQQPATFTARLRDQAGDYRTLVWQVIGQGGQLFLAGQAPPLEETALPEEQEADLVAAEERSRAAELLRRQAVTLDAVAAISSSTATHLELDQLLQEVVAVTQQRFGLSSAQVYLLNTLGDGLELAAAATMGQEVAERTIAVQTHHSLVARAARDQQPALANDVMADDPLRSPELLADTRSALALPMLAGNELVGVFAVQDSKSERFDETDAGIFTALASQTAVAVENARSFARAQAAVAETNSLMRRLTREGWEGYLREQAPELAARGFVFDAGGLTPVAPLEGAGIPTVVEDGPAVLARALQIHDEVIGELALVAADGAFDEEAAQLVAAIAEQLSARIENLRLTNETQQALTETAALYRAGTELNRARSYEEVLEVMRAHSVAGRDASSLALVLFGQPLLPGQAPGRVELAAAWSDAAAGDGPPVYPESMLAAIAEALDPDDLMFVGSLEAEDSLQGDVRDYLAGALDTKSALFVPLVAGGQWIGYLAAAYRQIVAIAGSELQRLRTLTGQASVAIQSISLLQAAQQRARRERVLREVSTRVRSVTDVDLIMRTAVREIGQVLGRETFLLLGDEEPGAAGTGGDQAGQEAGQEAKGDG